MIRVLLVDDQELVRTGLRGILRVPFGFEVVGECADGGEVIAAVEATAPDVVLMDVRMPGVDGIEATRTLRAEGERPPVLVLTTFDEDEVLWGAVAAGACGFVLKDATAPALIAATRAVAGGGAWFDPAVTPRVLEAYRHAVRPRQRERTRLEQLSDRETAVLRGMARGATNRELAESLHVSEATVKSHVGSIFLKLGVRDRAAAIVFAFDHSVVTPGAAPNS